MGCNVIINMVGCRKADMMFAIGFYTTCCQVYFATESWTKYSFQHLLCIEQKPSHKLRVVPHAAHTHP